MKQVQLAIIGGGPAGLAAAIAAREKGVEVRQYPLKCYEACGIIRVMDNV